MTAPMAWFDIPDRHFATATRFYQAAVRTGLTSQQSARLTLSVFRTPVGEVAPLAASLRRPSGPRSAAA